MTDKDKQGVPIIPIDGSGLEYYNIRQMILGAKDRQAVITYADFGTKDQRVTQIDYSSPTVYPTNTARKVLTYTLVGNRYRRDSINWVLI